MKVTTNFNLLKMVCIALGGWFATVQASTNTPALVVQKATIVSQNPIGKPLVLSPKNNNGQAFSWDEVFNYNIFDPTLRPAPSAPNISFGQSLSSDGDKAMFRRIDFTVDASRFVNANLMVEGITHYRIIHNGVGVPYITSFTPQRHNISLLVLTPPQHTDTFKVRLESDSAQLKALVVNATGKRTFTLADQQNGVHCTSLELSASGKYLLATYYNMLSSTDYHYYTTITDVASGRVVFRSTNYQDLQWMPHTDKCYFTRDANGMKQLYALNPVTLQERVLARNLTNGTITFSPTGSFLILQEKEQSPNRTQRGVRRVTDPDDRSDSFHDVYTLYKYDLVKKQMQRLTFGNETMSLQDISPDGKYLLATTERRNLSRRPFSFVTLHKINLETLQSDTIFTDQSFVQNCIFSPDGKKILMVGSPDSFEGIGRNVDEGQIANLFDYQLFLIDEHKKVRALTRDFDPSVNHIMWPKKLNKIYFTADNKDRITLHELNPQTGAIRQVATQVEVLGQVSCNGTHIAYNGHSAQGSRNIYVCDLSQRNPKSVRIGDTDNQQVYADVQTATWTDWNFRSSQGDSIYSRYYLPANFDASKKYPMIVYYYGGVSPSARYFEYSYPFQVLAGQGYVVYVIQPRGTVGFGQKFAAQHVNAWGKGTANDIIEGVSQFADNHSFVDKTKIGCIGASYGGFMTQYLISHSNLFAAAISHAGISNIASYWGGGTWGYSYSSVASADSYPWNNPELYTKQSPLFNADKIHTPLLLLHGTADNNVPPAESMQMYTALRLLGHEVSLLQIDGENHVINDAGKKAEWQNSIFAWFAKYLKNEPEWWDSLYPTPNK